MGVPGETPLEDLLQIQVLDHHVLALDARGGVASRERLRLGEEVLVRRTRGKVGVALTDRRVLAVAATSAAWQEERYRLGESVVAGPFLGDRVALLVTSRRVIGFDGGSGNLVEADLGVREQVLETAVGANVAVAVTGRRAVAVSPFAGGFFPVDLHKSERFVSLEAAANVATVRTSHRLLTFRAPSGSWSETRLGLGN